MREQNGPPVLTRVALHVLAASAIVVAVIALVLLVVQRDVEVPPDSGAVGELLEDRGFLALRAVSAVIFTAGGWYLTMRRPRFVLGPLALVGGLGNAVGPAGAMWVLRAELVDPGLPGSTIALWSTWTFALEPLALGAILVLFPSGHLPPGRLRWPGLVVLLLAAGGAVAAAATQPFADPAEWLHGSAPAGGFETDSAPLFAIVMVAAMILTVLRWRGAVEDERQALRPVAVLAAVGLFVPAALPLPGGQILIQAHTVVLLLVVVGVALRHEVLGLEVIVNRTLLYVVLSLAVAGAYGIVIAVIVATGGRSGGASSVAAAVIASIVVSPARGRAQRAVNRMLYGDRDEPYAVVSRLGARLETATGVDRLLPELVDAVADVLRLPYVALDIGLGDDDRGVRLVEHGRRPDVVEQFPMMHGGVAVGTLLVARRSGVAVIPAAERELLADIARQAAAAATNVLLSSQLLRSQQRALEAVQGERRRLRRDLHDGLGPVLTAAASRVDAARNVVAANHHQADDLLAQVRGDLTSALSDLRRLVYALRPPALEQLGLAGAVQAYATRAPIPVLCRLPDDLPALPEPIELAAYRIVTEAVTNVIRHAEATMCTVTISIDDLLEIDVVDDGTRAAEWHPGVGMTSIAERVLELGGTWSAGPSNLGGVVHVELPIAMALGTA